MLNKKWPVNKDIWLCEYASYIFRIKYFTGLSNRQVGNFMQDYLKLSLKNKLLCILKGSASKHFLKSLTHLYFNKWIGF